MLARVIVIAGPSGSGKSRLAERTGLPVLRLDDFYKDGSDPTLPHITDGANAGIVDWDDPASWLIDDAFVALETLCRNGVGDVPVYDIAHDGRTGWQRLDLGGASHFVAEGIFARRSCRAPARPACWPRRCACASTLPSPSGAGSPVTCASTGSRRSCWCAAGSH